MNVRPVRERLQQALSVAVLALATLIVVMTLRGVGVLEPLELMAYDHFLRWQAVKHTPASRVAVIGATEEDLNRWGWPLPDEVLAQVLERIAVAGPRAIGIDLYRDAPRPPGTERFNAVLVAKPEIVVVFKLGEGKRTGIPAPAVVQDEQRIGFADMVPDTGGIVRRGLLFLDDGMRAYQSLALRLALRYLESDGQRLTPAEGNPDHLRIGRTVVPPLEANDGGYVDLDAAGYQFLLDYAGGPSPFPTQSFQLKH